MLTICTERGGKKEPIQSGKLYDVKEQLEIQTMGAWHGGFVVEELLFKAPTGV